MGHHPTNQQPVTIIWGIGNHGLWNQTNPESCLNSALYSLQNLKVFIPFSLCSLIHKMEMKNGDVSIFLCMCCFKRKLGKEWKFLICEYFFAHLKFLPSFSEDNDFRPNSISRMRRFWGINPRPNACSH